jgi:hypothetical protein
MIGIYLYSKGSVIGLCQGCRTYCSKNTALVPNLNIKVLITIYMYVELHQNNYVEKTYHCSYLQAYIIENV